MGVRVWIALAIYVGLLATLATSLYDPFESGRDDTWAIALLVVAVHVALGVAVARWWVLAAPVVAGLAAFFAGGAAALAWLILVFGVPIALVATALGALAGWRLGRRAVPVAATLFALAAAPAAWAAVETIKRGTAPHVSAAAQRQLPTEESLASDCEDESGSASRIDPKARALLRELERNPDALVTYTYYYADDPDEDRRDITVRELAEEALRDLEANPGCREDLRRRLEAELD